MRGMLCCGAKTRCCGATLCCGAAAFVAMSAMSAAEYDALIYPGFVRRNVARWNEDGSAAPLSRARGPRGETSVLHLRSGEIDQDVSAIEAEVRQHARVCVARKTSREETRARGRA